MAGWVVNILLLGCFLHAFSNYYGSPGRFKRDGKVLTGVLWTVLSLELLYFAISLEELFHMSGQHNGTLASACSASNPMTPSIKDNQKRDTLSLVTAGVMFSFQPIVGGFVQCTVQAFLTFRASGARRAVTLWCVKRTDLTGQHSYLRTGYKESDFLSSWAS